MPQPAASLIAEAPSRARIAAWRYWPPTPPDRPRAGGGGNGGQVAASGPPHGGDQFQHAGAGTKVAGFRYARPAGQVTGRPDMGIRQIHDVDIVANGTVIARGEISAKDRKCPARRQRSLDGKGDDVRFRLVLWVRSNRLARILPRRSSRALSGLRSRTSAVTAARQRIIWSNCCNPAGAAFVLQCEPVKVVLDGRVL